MSMVFDFKDIRSRIKGDPWIGPRPMMKCEESCPGDDTCENLKYCMCGGSMYSHTGSDGHDPVSVHDHCSGLVK
jgi:hypothetical protein